MNDYILLPETSVKTVCESDVVVGGGGIAGISAALAAARNGAKVLLVEKGCLLGGLATLGLIAIYLPLCDGLGHQVSFGIAEELLKLSIRHFAEGEYPDAWIGNGREEERKAVRYKVQFNPHMFALEAESLLQAEGVKILYDTKICQAVVKENRITHLIIENKGGRQAISAKSFVDATGDAEICYLAGEETKEFEKKNVLANWYYFFSKGKIALERLGFAELSDDEALNAENDETVESGEQISDIKYGGVDGEEISQMLCDGHAQMLKKILAKRQKDPTYVPVTSPAMPQLRMIRRIVGKYTMDRQEANKDFDTGIGCIGDWRKKGPVYVIPFETLYGNKIQNLITAGRCISVSDNMWDITRVIPACAVTGEAAGTAAAMSGNFSALDISSLREMLKKQGVKLTICEVN